MKWSASKTSEKELQASPMTRLVIERVGRWAAHDLTSCRSAVSRRPRASFLARRWCVWRASPVVRPVGAPVQLRQHQRHVQNGGHRHHVADLGRQAHAVSTASELPRGRTDCRVYRLLRARFRADRDSSPDVKGPVSAPRSALDRRQLLLEGFGILDVMRVECPTEQYTGLSSAVATGGPLKAGTAGGSPLPSSGSGPHCRTAGGSRCRPGRAFLTGTQQESETKEETSRRKQSKLLDTWPAKSRIHDYVANFLGVKGSVISSDLFVPNSRIVQSDAVLLVGSTRLTPFKFVVPEAISSQSRSDPAAWF
jgi:hypothetical protein